MTRQPTQRLQPLRALRAIHTLLTNPERTDAVFEIMAALRGRTNLRTLARLRLEAPALASAQPELLDTLTDRAALAALPHDSLGQHYLRFIDREGITPDGLVEASNTVARDEDDAALAWVERRGRDSHDLWHVITGYGTQPFGEICVVAFSAGQIGHPGFAAIALFGLLDAGRTLGYRSLARATWEAWSNGRSAGWLPAQDWDRRLAQPLAEVRADLGIPAPEAYQQLRSELIAARDAVAA